MTLSFCQSYLLIFISLINLFTFYIFFFVELEKLHIHSCTSLFCLYSEIAISDPSFIGERSYMAFHTPRNIRENLDIKVQFKSTKSSGLLLYMAETLSERTSDFLSVELVDWLVVLRYNTGSENPTVLTSENKADHGFGAGELIIIPTHQ